MDLAVLAHETLIPLLLKLKEANKHLLNKKKLSVIKNCRIW
jgi:hypothetical protein